jgi:nucleoside 2-deoxyribosyltransferase
VGLQKQQLCREYGFEGLFPLDNDETVGADAGKIFRANCSLMRQADVGLFNLTPFRGPSADAGTVFELGFFFAQGKPVYGYSSAAKTYRERVAAAAGLQVDQNRPPRDHDGHAVEDFGLYDNLMIDRAIHDSGGVLIAVEEKSEDAAASLAAFRAFKACLMAISDRTKRADVGKA